jgi:hypothetical protein
MSRLSASLLAAFPLLASIAAAQSTTIIDRAEQKPPVAPEAPAAAPSARAPGADSDEGTQRIAETRRLPFKFAASLDTQLYGTDNVFLADDSLSASSQDALVFVGTVSLRAETLPVVVCEGQLVTSAGFSYQRYVHDVGPDDAGVADLDFESYSLPLGLAYRWGQGYEATAGLTLGQLYSVRGEPSHEKLYASATASAGLRKLTELNRGLILSTGLGLAHGETWTSLSDVPAGVTYRDDRNDKLDGTADVALYVLRGPFVIVPYVSLRHTHYYHYEEEGLVLTGGGQAVDRDDTTVSAGLSASWNFADWGSARVFASYDERFTNADETRYAYDAGTAGLGLSLSLRY